MTVEKLAENFHSHASAYGLVKDRFWPATFTAASPVLYAHCFGLQSGISDFLKIFSCLRRERFAAPILSVSPRPHIAVRNSGDDRDRTGNLRLAKPTLSQLSYVPGPQKKPEISNLRSQISKWARVDSDYRPHAYQACALTN